MGVSAPVTSTMTAKDVSRADALGGSAKAAPSVDAAAYTPAAKLTGTVDVEDGHAAIPAQGESGMENMAAMSAQQNWSADRPSLFGKLCDWLSPIGDWFLSRMPVQTLESGLVLAGVQAHDLSVPVVMMMSAEDGTSGKPTATPSKPDKGSSSGQDGDRKRVPLQAKRYPEVPRWRLVLAMTPGSGRI